MIVFPCKYTPEHPVIQTAVASARKYMPHERVLVVDSDSDDKSYIREVTAMDAEVADIANHNYETGAWWYAYNNYPHEWFFYLVQDSCEFLHSMHWAKDYEVSALMTVPSWSLAGPQHYEWALENIKKSDYELCWDRFVCMFGSMMFIHRSLLDKIRAKNFYKVLPTDKVGSCAMERLWGIALSHEGYSTVPEVTQFVWSNPEPVVTKYLKKTWIHRA